MRSISVPAKRLTASVSGAMKSTAPPFRAYSTSAFCCPGVSRRRRRARARRSGNAAAHRHFPANPRAPTRRPRSSRDARRARIENTLKVETRVALERRQQVAVAPLQRALIVKHIDLLALDDLSRACGDLLPLARAHAKLQRHRAGSRAATFTGQPRYCAPAAWAGSRRRASPRRSTARASRPLRRSRHLDEPRSP